MISQGLKESHVQLKPADRRRRCCTALGLALFALYPIPMLQAAPLSAAPAASAPATPAVVERLAGGYALRGVRELAAALRLRADGHFDYGISYGAVDMQAAGTWRSDGQRVWLQTEQAPATFRWGRAQSEFHDDFPMTPDRPVQLLVRVEEPERRFIWSNVEVQAEFTNGQVRSGVTGRNGMLAFLERTDEPWRGHKVSRLAVRYRDMPWTWFEVNEPMKTAVIYFRPGALMRPAFKQMVLDVRPTLGSARELRTIETDGESSPGGSRETYFRE